MREKIILFLISLFLVLNCCGYLDVSAADQSYVFTLNEGIEKVDDNEYIVPLYISSNNGIMGFRIDLKSQNDLVSIHSITKGSVTKKGTFLSDVSASGVSSASVVWNNTSEITTDGTLMYIGVSVADDSISNLNIHVSYSQMDTFNEKYEDVILVCSDISYPLREPVNGEQEDETTEEENIPSEEKKTEENTEENTEEMTEEMAEVTTTEAVLEEQPNTKLTDKEKRELLESEEEKKPKEEAKKAREQVKIINKIGPDKIKDAVKKALTLNSYKNLSFVPEDGEEKFYQDVQNYLKDMDGVDYKLVNSLDVRGVVEQIRIDAEDELEINETHEIATPTDHKEVERKHEKKMTMLSTIFGALVVFVVTFLGVCLWRKKYDKKKK